KKLYSWRIRPYKIPSFFFPLLFPFFSLFSSLFFFPPFSFLPPSWCASVPQLWLRCLHCRLTARRSWVRFLHGALLALGGRSSPDLQCSGGLSPGPFCVEFAFSPRVHK